VVIGQGKPLMISEREEVGRLCILLGSGGHAKVVVDALGSQGVNVDGVVDPGLEKVNSSWRGIKVVGNDDWLLAQNPDDFILVNGIGSLPGKSQRQLIYDRYKSAGFGFLSIVHRSTTIGSEVVLGEGSQIMAGVVIQANSTIGNNTIVNTGATIDHDCVVGNNVHIAPGVNVSGNVFIEDDVHLGTGSSVIQGVTIGKRSIVAAGTVAFKALPPASKLIGAKPRLTAIEDAARR